MRLLVFILAAVTAGAQSGIQSFALPAVGSPRTEYRVVATGSAVRGAPFSGEEGGSKVFRDSTGRTRLEPSRTPGFIEINDPAKGEFFLLDVARRTAYRVTYLPVGAAEPGPPVPYNPIGARGTLMTGEPAKTEIEPEPLGKREIQGIETEGYRVAANGSVQEVWYSPRLGLNVLTVLRHPAMGEVRYEIGNLKTSEPEEALFAPPQEFTIVDRPPMFQVEADTQRSPETALAREQ